MSEYQDGDLCPECSGTIRAFTNGQCSCHISPPCSSCVDARLMCGVCGFEPQETQPEKPVHHFTQPQAYMRHVHFKDLGDGKEFSVERCDCSSGSTMVYTGKYRGPVTAKDIFDSLGDGTFGHRGPQLFGGEQSGRYTYTKITD